MTEEIKTYDRPMYKVRVKVNERHLWPIFHPHHYMTDSLASGATFYTFYMYKDGEETLFGCCGVITQIAKQPSRRLTRLVILPEFQGLGLAKHIINHIGEYYQSKGIRLYSATFHPRLGDYRARSEYWQESSNHLSERTVHNDFFEQSDMHIGLRDGVAMHRYYYDSSKLPESKRPQYNLLYDTLALSELKTKKAKSNDSNEILNLTKTINKIEKEINEIEQKVFENDSLIKEQKQMEIDKQNLKRLFKKPKRKPLSKQEREQLKKAKG